MGERCVLLVDSNPDFRGLVGAILRRAAPGAEVVQAPDMRTAQRLIEEHTPGFDALIVAGDLSDGSARRLLLSLPAPPPSVVLVERGVQAARAALAPLNTRDVLSRLEVDLPRLRQAVARCLEPISQAPIEPPSPGELRILRGAISMAAVVVDQTGVITFFNRGASEIFGVAESEMLGRPRLHELISPHPAQQELLQELLLDALAGRERRAELSGLRQGEEFPLECSLHGLEGPGDQAGGAVLLGRDVTSRRTLENQLQESMNSLSTANEELREAQRLQGQFVTTISHELRTPLNAVIGYADLLLAGIYGPLGDTQNTACQGIRRRSGDLLQMINDLLDLSRIEADKLQLEASIIDLPEFMSDLAETARVLAADKELAVELVLAPYLPPLRSDRGKLRQILMNLVGNAVKFTERGTIGLYVTLDSARTPGLRFTVSDTGIGIEPDDLEHIFNAFRQADGSSSRRFGGSGLGLSICRGLASFLGGRMEVRSAVGQGSTFSLVLPLRI